MRLVLVVLLWTVCAVTSAAASPGVHYAVSTVMSDGGLRALSVELKFRGDDDGETSLRLPNEWGGEAELYKGIRDLTVSGAGATVAPVEQPFLRIVRHKPGAALTVRYRVVQYWEGEPIAAPRNEYRPVIQPGYFHVLGNALFVAPERDDDTSATFAFKSLPKGWSFVSDLEHGTMGRKLVLADVIESVLVGGDFRVSKRGLLRVAIRGAWKFSDETFVDNLQRIFSSHHKFWGDPPEPFLVTVLPLKKGQPSDSSLGGTGRDDAFAFFATDNTNDVALNRVLAHEHLHTWIPRRIGAMPERDEAKDYWLSEGFTDFYTARLLLRDGVWTLDDFVGAMNEVLSEYAQSPVRAAPNTRILTDFWHDGATQRLPYQRGQLLATIWDQRLRAASAGARDFDDVMLAMKAEATAQGSKRGLASVLFPAQMQMAGVDVGDDLVRFVENGDVLLLPKDIFAPCGDVETIELAAFDRGFDVEKTSANGNVIVGLADDSPAFRAGLRNGMKILKREAGKPGDSRVMLTYRVLDGTVERVISYLPEGKQRITEQEFKLRTSLDDDVRKSCVARLGGV